MKCTDEKNLKAFGQHVRKIRTAKSNSLNEIAFSRGGELLLQH